jgi:hypothetical protein
MARALTVRVMGCVCILALVGIGALVSLAELPWTSRHDVAIWQRDVLAPSTPPIVLADGDLRWIDGAKLITLSHAGDSDCAVPLPFSPVAISPVEVDGARYLAGEHEVYPIADGRVEGVPRRLERYGRTISETGRSCVRFGSAWATPTTSSTRTSGRSRSLV